VDQHEADAVVEAEHDAFGERRQVHQGEADLQHRHQRDDDAATGGGARHLPPRRAVFGDVVLAVAAGVIGDVARQQAQVRRDETAGALARLFPLQQGLEHLRRQQRVGAAGDGKHLAQAPDQLVEPCQQVGQADADALVAGAAPHAVEHFRALRQHHVDLAQFRGRRCGAVPAGALQERYQGGVLRQEG
jgi:hypothetical protein